MFKFLAVAPFVSLALARPLDYCQQACDSVESCASSKYGSYCKLDLGQRVCFGLLVRENGRYCFAPNDPSCDDKKYMPLSCSDQPAYQDSNSSGYGVNSKQLDSHDGNHEGYRDHDRDHDHDSYDQGNIHHHHDDDRQGYGISADSLQGSDDRDHDDYDHRAHHDNYYHDDHYQHDDHRHGHDMHLRGYGSSGNSDGSYDSENSYGDYCQQVCDSMSTCSGSKYGSYCKSYQTVAVCFGMYVRPDGSYCFQPNDPSCDDSTYQPLSCNYQGEQSADTSSSDGSYGQASSSSNATTSGDSDDDSNDDSNGQTYNGDFCQMTCDSLQSCSMSKYGSYCKADLDSPVCFGILVRDDGSYCFQPRDPDCDDKIYQPLSCEGNAGSSAGQENGSASTQYDETSGSRNGYDDKYCQATCDSLSDCANSKYGSYCNMNVDEPSCFGILVRDSGSYCFEPTDPDCNDQLYKPLPCRSFRGNLLL
jgi:hypothetical protein